MENNETINPKYCSKELGEILYRDKLISISKYENVANLMRRYNKNFDYNDKIKNDLNKEVKDGNILEFISLKEFGYDKEYLETLDKLSFREESIYRICDGITEKGYLEFSNKYYISKDFQTTYGITIIEKDVVNKILTKGNKPEKILSFIEADYINNLKINKDDKVLLIGCDLGYLGFKHPNKKLYIYEEDDILKDFLKNNIYNQIGIDVEYISKENILDKSFDKIVINPSLDNDLQLKLFYELDLYNLNNIYTPKLSLILSKFKLDLQDLIMTDKEQVIDSLIEGLKEMKGIGQIILDVQLDFIEKAEGYLEENNIYFDNYKKYQKFMRNDEIIYEILKRK